MIIYLLTVTFSRYLLMNLVQPAQYYCDFKESNVIDGFFKSKKQPSEVFYKKAVFKNFTILRGKLCRSLSLMKGEFLNENKKSNESLIIWNIKISKQLTK